MKILFLTHLFPPHHIGGTENYTHGLAQGLMRNGHQVQVLCAEDWITGDRYWNGVTDDIFDGVPVRRLHLNWTKAPDVNGYLFDNPLVGNYVRDYLAQWQPDVVHVTSCITLSARVMLEAKRAGVPVVVTLTDFWFICPRVTLLRSDNQNCDGQVSEAACLECLLGDAKFKRVLKQVLPASVAANAMNTATHYPMITNLPGLRGMMPNLRQRRSMMHQALEFADRILIDSEVALDLFRRNGFQMPIDIVRYGHDLGWLKQYTGRKPSPFIRFGFIGQIAPLKGPQLLIQAFNQVCANNPARLYIYGNLDKDKSFGQHLRDLARGHSEIEFRGTYAHQESARVFADMDVLVVPSLWNDFPLIINEAFATQTPVLASDFGGMAEFVHHEVNGLLFKRGDVTDLARQMERLIREPGLLPGLRRGVPRVKVIDEAVAEMESIYRTRIKETMN